MPGSEIDVSEATTPTRPTHDDASDSARSSAPWYKASSVQQLSAFVRWSLQRPLAIGACLYFIGAVRSQFFDRMLGVPIGSSRTDVTLTVAEGLSAVFSVLSQLLYRAGPSLPIWANIALCVLLAAFVIGRSILRAGIAKLRAYLDRRNEGAPDLTPGQERVLSEYERYSLSAVSIWAILPMALIAIAIFLMVAAGSASISVQALESVVARGCSLSCDRFITNNQVISGIQAVSTSDRLYVKTPQGIRVIQLDDLVSISTRKLRPELHGLDRLEELYLPAGDLFRPKKNLR